jgi:hypothetical protein
MERQTVMEFYLAESENTGNPNTVEIDSYFTEQRIFALAALGVPPGQDFESEFLALKKQHGLEMPRLRLSDIYNKPSFVGDLIDMIDKQHCPVFIEAYDKHFFAVVNVVDRLVVPFLEERDIQPSFLQMKEIMANYMTLYAPLELTKAFAECCQGRSHAKVRVMYERIINWAEWCRVPPLEAAHAIGVLTADSLEEFKSLSPAQAVARVLPIPGNSDSAGRLLWVLPNLSAFISVLSRINRFTHQPISEITLYCGEECQYCGTLLRNRKVVEELSNLRIARSLKSANFDVSGFADLRVLSSMDRTTAQAAEMLAGFLTRYLQDAIWGREKMARDKVAVFDRLAAIGDKDLGRGVSLVAPENLTKFFGLEQVSHF